MAVVAAAGRVPRRWQYSPCGQLGKLHAPGIQKTGAYPRASPSAVTKPQVPVFRPGECLFPGPHTPDYIMPARRVVDPARRATGAIVTGDGAEAGRVARYWRDMPSTRAASRWRLAASRAAIASVGLPAPASPAAAGRLALRTPVHQLRPPPVAGPDQSKARRRWRLAATWAAGGDAAGKRYSGPLARGRGGALAPGGGALAGQPSGDAAGRAA